MFGKKNPEDLIHPFKPQELKEDKRYVQCANCGKAIPELQIMTHYKFCAMVTPPAFQPFREQESFED